MPMIDFEWNPRVYRLTKMQQLSTRFEEILREAIAAARPSAIGKDYRVIVRGRENGPVVHNAPDLEIRIFYHEGWEFSDQELEIISGYVGASTKEALCGANESVENVKIRFYSLTGYKGVTL